MFQTQMADNSKGSPEGIKTTVGTGQQSVLPMGYAKVKVAWRLRESPAHARTVCPPLTLPGAPRPTGWMARRPRTEPNTAGGKNKIK